MPLEHGPQPGLPEGFTRDEHGNIGMELPTATSFASAPPPSGDTGTGEAGQPPGVHVLTPTTSVIQPGAVVRI